MAKQNVVDRLVGYVSPRAGAARAAYRRKIELMNGVRSYEGAGSGRLSQGWKPAGAGSDAAATLVRDGQVLRDRSRDLERNNPLATKIVTTHADNFVGPGIMPRAKTGDEDLNQKINDLFDEWSSVCHTDGTLDFYGLSYLMARMLVVDGEVFFRRRTRRRGDGLPVPLQLQVLDSEFCDWSKTGKFDGNYVINGVAFDQIGRRVGYWQFERNPSASSFWSFFKRTKPNFIRAQDVIHVFEPKTNQVRGVPWLSSVMVDLKEVRDYEIAENVRKKSEACMVGVIIPGDEEDDPNIGIEEDSYGVGARSSDGTAIERMQPGMFVVAHGGKDVRFNSPAISVGVEAYLRTRHRNIASGARIPYELMTGDYSQSNFASGKLGLMAYRRFVDAVQWHIIIHQCLSRVWDWFVEAAVVVGKIPADAKVGVEWQPPEFESINRLEEAQADQLEVRMGKRSMPDVIARTGRNPDDVLKEQDEWNTKVDKTASGVVLDSDPRKVSNSGQAQLTQKGDGNAGT